MAIYLFFGAIVLVDGIRHLMRSDIEILLYGGFAAALLGFVALLMPKANEEENPLKNNFISLWMERKRLEERKRIDELKK